MKQPVFKYEEVAYDRKQSGRHAIISIVCMVASLYLAFMSFMMWFLSWWQFSLALVLLVSCLIGAWIAFKRI